MSAPQPFSARGHRPLPRLLAVLVAGTFFMEILDGTIIATAAPAMARSLGTTPAQIGLCITSYLVTLAVTLPLGGWIADRLGARRTFVTAIVVFCGASAFCAAASSLPELAAFRVLQGLGGALMVPVGRLVVMRGTAPHDVIRAIAYLTWPALLAPILAPPLGGLLVTYASWRWIFLVNLPLGAVAIAAAIRLVPRSQAVVAKRLDWAGAILTGSSLAAVVGASALLGGVSVRWLPIIGMLALGVAIGALAVRHLLRTNNPLLDLRLLGIRSFRVPHAGGAVFRIAINAVPFLLPLMFQERLGWSALRAGTLVLWVFVGNLAVKPVTTPMLRRLGFRSVLLFATTAASIATAGCALFSHGTPIALMIVILLLGGAFRSIGFTAYNTLAFADVRDSQMSAANTLASTLQNLSQGLGVAFGVLALTIATDVTGNPIAYPFAFIVVSIALVGAAAEALLLPHNIGERIGGRSRASS